MSDDGYARYRKNETHGRGGSSGPSVHGEDDPLAELARLIGQDQPAPPPDWRASSASYEDYQYSNEQQADSRYPDEQQADSRFDNRGYPAKDPYGAQASDSQSFNAYGDQRFPGFGETAQQQPGQRYEDPRYFEDQGSDDDFEEPPPPPRSRGGLASFVVVLLLAGLGTAGAFAYRSLFHRSADNSPPVILADAAPNKILPNNQSSDSTGQADSTPDGQERMLSREEPPMNVQNAASAPSVVYSGSGQPAQLPMASTPPVLAPAPLGPQTSAAPQTSPSGEPRRVHTVTIRPDQQRVASSNAAFPTGSTGGRNGNQQSSAPPDGDAPLSLSPQSSPPESSPPHPKLASTGSRPVQPPPAAAPPPVSAPAAASAGSFFVQVSAQKSEEDAQTAFRTMQAKYPDQLGGRQPVIRRKDLEKGVFFGVQVGPFASRDDAVQLCESLKSAGGACMIQKN
jgi:cell division septation protein DedD